MEDRMATAIMQGPMGGECCEAKKMTVTSALVIKRDRLRSELLEVERVLAVVEKHPEIQEVFDAVSSIRGII
jgi:hypothetical protein